jgi:hypothetical protein
MAFPRTAALMLAGFAACAPVQPPAARPRPSLERAATITAPATDASTTADAASPPASPVLRRTYTGQEVPRVVVHNAFLRVQHVFLDWRLVGRVDVHASAAFDVPVGTHTITCADSPHLTDNPGSVTESFESGFTYTYEILGQ